EAALRQREGPARDQPRDGPEGLHHDRHAGRRDPRAVDAAEALWLLGPGRPRSGHLAEWMAATTLQSLEGYRALLGRAGFVGGESEDLSDEWRSILRARLARLRAMRRDMAARLGEARFGEYEQLYAFFVGLVEEGKLGGGRFSGSA